MTYPILLGIILGLVVGTIILLRENFKKDRHINYLCSMDATLHGLAVLHGTYCTPFEEYTLRYQTKVDKRFRKFKVVITEGNDDTNQTSVCGSVRS